MWFFRKPPKNVPVIAVKYLPEQFGNERLKEQFYLAGLYNKYPNQFPVYSRQWALYERGKNDKKHG